MYQIIFNLVFKSFDLKLEGTLGGGIEITTDVILPEHNAFGII